MSGLIIAGEEIMPGERKQISLTTAKLYDFTDMKMPVVVVRGQKDGPTLFISAAIHGDEINGVDIVRRLLKHKALKRIRGTLIAIPIVRFLTSKPEKLRPRAWPRHSTKISFRATSHQCFVLNILKTKCIFANTFVCKLVKEYKTTNIALRCSSRLVSY